MFSLNKIIWLVVILIAVWYVFRFIEKKNKYTSSKKKSEDYKNKKNLDAFECTVCGLWSTGNKCNNKDCSSNS